MSAQTPAITGSLRDRLFLKASNNPSVFFVVFCFVCSSVFFFLCKQTLTLITDSQSPSHFPFLPALNDPSALSSEMSVAAKLRSPVKAAVERRAILGPTGNRVRVSEEVRRKAEVLKKPERRMKSGPEMPDSAVRNNVSVDSSESTDSSSSSSGHSSVRTAPPGRSPAKQNGAKRTSKVVRDGVVDLSPEISVPVKRCDWITANSDPLYISFHDEEWGVPVHDDGRLFELLVFSQALAELSWPAILHRRNVFRKLFENFDPSSIAQFTEKRLLSLKVDGGLILSEPKLRAIVENAKSVFKVQQEFGSFSNYCWRSVNHKPLRNGYRYARQVPVKSPKAEYISKDMMQRGFRCVGPTVIYSFLQVSGLVNDHLITCFRYKECQSEITIESRGHKIEDGTLSLTSGVEKTCLSKSLKANSLCGSS